MKAEEYAQVRTVLVKKQYREDGGATTLAFDPAKGTFAEDPRFMIDFVMSRNDTEPLTSEEFELRLAAQRKAGTYLE